MKFKVAILAIMTVLAVSTGVASAADEPKLHIKEMRHDFGDVFQQEKYEATFTIENTGAADLLISDVKPGCGCTVADYDRVIAPGKKGAIKLVLDGSKVTGKWTKTAVVHCNDPDRRTFNLTIAGNEIPYLEITPGNRLYLEGQVGEDADKLFTIRSNEKDLKLKITGFETDLEDLMTQSVEKGANPGEFKVRLSKTEAAKSSTVNQQGTLTLYTNSEAWPQHTLQVNVITKGTITAQPSTVNFGRVQFETSDKKGNPVVRNVNLVRNLGEFEVTNVEFSSPNFSAEVVNNIPGRHYRVQVTFDPPKRSQPRQVEKGEMVIHTNDPKEPTIRVKLVARSM